MSKVEIRPTDEEAAAANEAQKRALQYDKAMWILGLCQVCNGKHPSYKCCDRCNYDTHICHFCGDNLGHEEVSACYLLMDIEEGKLITTPEILQGWIQRSTLGWSNV